MRRGRGRWESEITIKTSFIVKAFQNYIDKWMESGKIVWAKAKGTLFQRFVFGYEMIGFFEKEWRITAVYDAVPKKKMNNKKAEVYRILKNMECVMQKKGLFRKNVYFKSPDYFQELQKYIPEIKASNRLSNVLNGNEKVIKLVKAINPEALTITLESIRDEYKTLIRGPEDLRRAMAEFYKNPTHITWTITLATTLQKGPRLKGKIEKIVQLFNEIVTAINRVEESVEAEIGR